MEVAKVKLEIGRLVLEGFDYHDHRRIAAAMERELARLIKERGLPTGSASSRGAAVVDADAFMAPANQNPRTIGLQVARSVYLGLAPRSDKG